jgi:hypothetical protein
MLDYNWYAYTVVHQWALLQGYSGANGVSVRAWLRLPYKEREDFKRMIFMGYEL